MCFETDDLVEDVQKVSDNGNSEFWLPERKPRFLFYWIGEISLETEKRETTYTWYQSFWWVNRKSLWIQFGIGEFNKLERVTQKHYRY